jgi:glycosyltransferase involved in cell wall biosynthesis
LRPVETYYENTFRIKAQGTTVINSVLFDKLLKMGVSEETILLLRNGCDTQYIQQVPIQQARMLVGLPENVPIIGYIGSIFARDAQLMADAFLKILDVHPQALLLAAGYFNASIEDMVGKPGSIIRTGSVQFDEIGSILSACDICWLPLKDTGANRGRWPIKLSDYMAAGRPVVSTNVGDLGHFVKSHDIGLVSNDTPLDLSSRIIELLADSEKRKMMGAHARRLAETDYSWDAITRKLENFYKVLHTG